MKILFVTPSYKPAYVYGGPAVSVSELAEALAAAGHEMTVYATTANGKAELDVPAGEPVVLNGVTIYYFRRQTGDHTHVSFGLWRKLWKTAPLFDVIHLQSWWSLLIFGAASICRIKRQSYILSPRGMLSGYSFQTQHSLPKKILHQLVGKRLLRRSYLHATSPLEWNDCLQINPQWKGFVLPNLFRFPESPAAKTPYQKDQGPLLLGFLSRIDPKKGLPLLFEALSQVKFDYRLKIAGTGEPAYIETLKAKAVSLRIDSRIEWCGWKSGEEKFAFYRSVDVYVLTSYNENFANTVTESLATGTPVFLSEGVGLASYVQANGVGWVCAINVPSIADGLEKVWAEREQTGVMNQEAPLLLARDYDQFVLARKYTDAYQSLKTS